MGLTVFGKSLILNSVKTAQVLFILAVFVFPVSAFAADNLIANSFLSYPDRTINEISSWFSKVLGASTTYINSTNVSTQTDLTGQTVLEDQYQAPNLTSKLDSTGADLDQMYLDYQHVTGEAVLMGLKWDNLTVSDILQSLDRMNNTLGENSKLAWLIQSWGWSQLDTVMTTENSVKANLATVRTVVSTSGMQVAAYDQLRDAAAGMESIATIIGDKTDTSSKKSLYGQYHQAQQASDKWDSLLAQLGQMQVSGNYGDLDEVKAQVLAANQLPNIAPTQALDLAALIEANKTLLAANHGATVATTWITDNPLQFKTLVSNTSLLSRQQVEVKYYLPSELTAQDIVASDPGLQIKYDPDHKRLVVQGSIVVAAGDTRVASVETADLWHFDSSPVASIKSQSVTLVNSLVNTSKFITAVEFKGRVDALAAQIADLQTKNATPEERIQSFRQIQMQMHELNTNFVQIQQLASKISPLDTLRKITVWPQMTAVSGMFGFALVGMTAVRKIKRRPKTSQKFNVFSTGITASDL